MSQTSPNNFLERLVEASLDGAPLPEPTNDAEVLELEQFLATEQLFAELADEELSQEWTDRVWNRIDADTSEADANVLPFPEPRPLIDDELEEEGSRPAETGAPVVPLTARPNRWPWMVLVAAAAAVLLVLYISPDADKADEAQSQDNTVSSTVHFETPENEAMARLDQGQQGLTRGLAPQEEQKEGGGYFNGEFRQRGEVWSRDSNRAGQLKIKSGSASSRITLDGRMLDIDATKEGLETGTYAFDLPTGTTTITLSADGQPTQGAHFKSLDAGGFADTTLLPPADPSAAPMGGMGWNGAFDSGVDSDSDGFHGGGDTWTKNTKGKRGKWDAERKDLVGDELTITDSSSSMHWSMAQRRRTQPKLTAGETDDNTSFDDFKRFLAERPKPYLEEMDVSERMFIRVLDAKNRPLPNTNVAFKANGQQVFTGKTYANGWLLFHPKSVAAASGAESFDLTFTSGSHTPLDYTIKRGTKERWEVRMPVERQLPARPQLDVVFLLDTTGSMSDEIERLQSTILDISDQVSGLAGNPEVRFGLVLYRDEGEAYVSQLHNFTSDVKAFKETLANVTADGGGDTPERLEIGLHRTIHEMAWSDEATRLVFLIADAPPHRADQNDFSYSRDIQTAVGKGIKVYPVASSGLNDDGEYVLRQLAQYTMAKFLFLTYGANGTVTPHDVPRDSFQPTTLDGLIIKIIRSELNGLELEGMTAEITESQTESTRAQPVQGEAGQRK